MNEVEQTSTKELAGLSPAKACVGCTTGNVHCCVNSVTDFNMDLLLRTACKEHGLAISCQLENTRALLAGKIFRPMDARAALRVLQIAPSLRA